MKRRRFRLSRRRWLAAVCCVVAGVLLAPRLLDRCFPLPADIIGQARHSQEATRVFDVDGHWLRAFLGPHGYWQFWANETQVNPQLRHATMAAEDHRFRRHWGVDILAVARAAFDNVRLGRRVSGASTITQQLARLLEPRPRTYASKLVEVLRAWQLEQRYSKDEILTAYLNLAPYGGNLVGVEAAAQAYFGKSAADVSLAEAALLAGLPQGPARLRPDRHSDRAWHRRDYVLERMLRLSYISPTEYQAALEQPVPGLRKPFPFLAPHWSRLVRERYPGKRILRTTLRQGMQEAAARRLRAQVRALTGDGVSTGAVVVLENTTGAVRALVGSADFFDAAAHGQVDGTTAARSPGSALKPFLYALAFESGLQVPETIVPDLPRGYAGYAPRNFDEEFRGLVTVREALVESLNLPAVFTAEQVGVPALHQLLLRLGLHTLTRDPQHYGLSLVLGGGEVTLLDLCSAYACLARLGRWLPPRVLAGSGTEAGVPVLSPETCYLVNDILADPARRGDTPLRNSVNGRVAWKTGTSWGFRDAWTIAFTPKYTVGVWLGNFDGRPGRGLIGQRAAAPVALGLIDELQGDLAAPTWYQPPKGLTQLTLCAASGLPGGPHCRQTITAWGCRGRQLPKCPVHRELWIDPQRQVAVCNRCRGGHQVEAVVREVWPPALAAWLSDRWPDRPLAPPHDPACPSATAAGRAPVIVSPLPEQRCRFVPDRRLQQLRLEARGTGDLLYWFVDNSLFAAESPGSAVFWPVTPGNHTIVCSDQFGHSTSVHVQVD